MLQSGKPIFTPHPHHDYHTTPLTFAVGDGVWGSTGQRNSGSVTAIWGTPHSESWSSGTKQITGIEVVYYAASATGTCSIDVSLQAVSASSTIVRVPSGVPLAIWTGSLTGILPNVLVTHSFSSSYTIQPNSLICTVFSMYETGSTQPTWAVQGLRMIEGRFTEMGLVVKISTASAYAITAPTFPSMRFITSDGGRLYYKGGYIGMSLQESVATNYQSTTTGTGIDGGDERGILWIPKKTYDITGFNTFARMPSSTSEMDVCLYRDTTLLASQSYDPSLNYSTSLGALYGMELSSSIRVYPNENIRITIKPRVLDVRWYRNTFLSTEDLEVFFGGDDAETNISVTNRLDGGAWNTPPSASNSFTQFQIYGYEVTGSALLSGSLKISGSVTNQGVPVSGATVRAIRQLDNIVISTASNASGYYEFYLTSSNYHTIVEYESGSQKYNALSKWDIGAV